MEILFIRGKTMKRFIIYFMLVAFVNMIGLAPAYCATIKVKEGMRIPLVITYLKTSKNTIAGEKINAVIQDDIKLNGVLVFKKDGVAVLNVADVKKAGFIGIPGEMVLIGGKVADLNGDEHNIEFQHKITGEEKTYPKVLLVTSLFFLFPLALFAFVKGGDAKLIQHAPLEVTLRNGFDFTPAKL